MSREGGALPAPRAFWWQFFMQPILLHEKLTEAGIKHPNGFTLQLWFGPDSSRTTSRAYVRRIWIFQLLMAIVIFGILAPMVRQSQMVWLPAGGHSFFSSPICGLLLGGGLALASLVSPPNGYLSALVFITAMFALQRWNFSLLVGTAAAGTVFGFLGKCANGSIWPISFIQAYFIWRFLQYVGMDSRIADFRALWCQTAIIATGWICIIPQRIQEGWLGVRKRKGGGQAVGTLPTVFSLLALMFLLTDSSARAEMSTYILAPLIILFRSPVWLIECIIQIIIFRRQKKTTAKTIHTSPVYYDQLCYYPLPTLANHIYLVAKTDPAEALKALEHSIVCPGINHINILENLEITELISIGAEHRFAELANVQGFWMNISDSQRQQYTDRAAWRALREAAGHLLTAGQATVPANQLSLLDRAAEALKAASSDSNLAKVIEVWKRELSILRGEASTVAQTTLHNPFFAGPPLAPDRGAELFRGREDVIRQIETILSDSNQSFSLSLIGPRRSGKTSLLKMLSQRLANTVAVFFDLQGNPVDTPQGFFSALARQTCEQALHANHLRLPTLADGPPFEAASAWLRALDDLPDQQRILLCIDEFECLDRMFPGDRRDLEKLMGLLRATIQHHRKVRLLVSGASPFDEVDRIWTHYFINVREVTLDLLARPTSLDLLCRPRSDFPENVIPIDVAEKIFDRTGGQPFLLQGFGTEIITILNRETRRQACLDDVGRAEEAMLDAWSYFRDTFGNAPAECQAALRILANDDRATMSPAVSRWLRRRCLITGEERLRIPIIGHWIREQSD